ncbi:unannotated protein [freshwater metagenome]|uniref:Unannotated protein n=1 Tax=freshwater metagenome TaxID=449393 RepID=A0A6J7JUK9_9ZZZZ
MVSVAVTPSSETAFILERPWRGYTGISAFIAVTETPSLTTPPIPSSTKEPIEVPEKAPGVEVILVLPATPVIVVTPVQPDEAGLGTRGKAPLLAEINDEYVPAPRARFEDGEILGPAAPAAAGDAAAIKRLIVVTISTF